MSKVLGMLAIVLAIWVGMTVYNEGVDQAFGGIFARFGASQADESQQSDDRPVTERAAGAFQRAWNRSEQRVDDILEDPRAAER